MKKVYRVSLFAVIISIMVISLSSGITKERSGGFGDLVDELYAQTVKQNSNLEAIEDGIKGFYKKKEDAMEKYSSFTGYNNRYYSDAKAKAATITDAATRQKANDIITASETRYRTKLTDWQASIAALNANENELTALHALLKIMITEPVIGKFQNTSLPDNGKLKEANGDLQKVIEKIKAITK